jgi:hypothetical protein
MQDMHDIARQIAQGRWPDHRIHTLLGGSISCTQLVFSDCCTTTACKDKYTHHVCCEHQFSWRTVLVVHDTRQHTMQVAGQQSHTLYGSKAKHTIQETSMTPFESHYQLQANPCTHIMCQTPAHVPYCIHTTDCRTTCTLTHTTPDCKRRRSLLNIAVHCPQPSRVVLCADCGSHTKDIRTIAK